MLTDELVYEERLRAVVNLGRLSAAEHFNNVKAQSTDQRFITCGNKVFMALTIEEAWDLIQGIIGCDDFKAATDTFQAAWMVLGTHDGIVVFKAL